MVRVFQILLASRVFRRLKHKHLNVLGLKANTGLTDMTELIETGKIKPVVGETFALNDTALALHAYEKSEQCGRIVITVH